MSQELILLGCLDNAQQDDAKPQAAVFLVLKDNTTNDTFKQFQDLLNKLKVECYLHKVDSCKKIFLGLYLTKSNCEYFAEEFSFHLPYHIKNEGPETLITRIKSLFLYGSTCYNSFTKINYTASFTGAHKDKYIPGSVDFLYTVRVQSELIYLILKRNGILKHRNAEKFGIISDFVPHTTQLESVKKHLSFFPGNFPLEQFRNYFGEEISLIYAWNNLWLFFALLPISLVSLIPTIYGVVTKPHDIVTFGLNSHVLKKINHIFLNSGNSWYVFFAVVWLGVFQYQWRKTHSILLIQWGVGSYSVEEELLINFKARLKILRVSIPNLILSVFGFLIAVALTMLIFVVTEVLLMAKLSGVDTPSALSYEFFSIMNAVITSSVYSILNILLGCFVLPFFCQKLTDFEGHRFQSFYDNSYNLKLTGYYIVSSYLYIFYLAFGLDVTVKEWLGIMWDIRDTPCIYGSCITKVRIQLVLQIFILRFKFLAKVAFRYFKTLYRTRNEARSTDDGITSDYWSTLIGERHEWSFWMVDRVLLYGFIALFSFFMPLITVFAGFVEIFVTYLELYVLVHAQRPVSHRKADIASWEGVLFLINVVSVISNSLAVAIYLTLQQHTVLIPTILVCVLTVLICLVHIQEAVAGDRIQLYRHEQYEIYRQRFKLQNTEVSVTSV